MTNAGHQVRAPMVRENHTSRPLTDPNGDVTTENRIDELHFPTGRRRRGLAYRLRNSGTEQVLRCSGRLTIPVVPPSRASRAGMDHLPNSNDHGD